jgi:hypothetical protein
MKHLFKEELNQMKYLFGYERGKVISEQNLLTEDSKTLDLFESTLPEFWGDDFIYGTTFSEESIGGMVYYIATEPDGTKYYFYYYPSGNPDNTYFKFVQYQHDEDILTADNQPQIQSQGREQGGGKLTTAKAQEMKKKASEILQELIDNAGDSPAIGFDFGIAKGQKKTKWEESKKELDATPDDDLCSSDNQAKVKSNLISAEEDMGKNGKHLTDNEKELCQELIDMLKEFPQYCNTTGGQSNPIQGSIQSDLGNAPQDIISQIKKVEDDILNSVTNKDVKDTLTKELNTNRDNKSIGKSTNQTIAYNKAQDNLFKKKNKKEIEFKGFINLMTRLDNGTYYTIYGPIL